MSTLEQIAEPYEPVTRNVRTYCELTHLSRRMQMVLAVLELIKDEPERDHILEIALKEITE